MKCSYNDVAILCFQVKHIKASQKSFKQLVNLWMKGKQTVEQTFLSALFMLPLMKIISVIQEAITAAVCCKFFELYPVKLHLPHFCAPDELQGSNAQARVCVHCGAGVYQQNAQRRISLFCFYHLTIT